MSSKDLDNLSLAQGLSLGLNQVIDFKNGNTSKAKSRVVKVREVEKIDRIEVKEIRNQLGLTQKLFAKVLGVSVKTVEAWESGNNHPNGSASRLLEIFKNKPYLIEEEQIIEFK